MAKQTVFDYAREATEVEEKLLLLLDPPTEDSGAEEETSAGECGTDAASHGHEED